MNWRKCAEIGAEPVRFIDGPASRGYDAVLLKTEQSKGFQGMFVGV